MSSKIEICNMALVEIGAEPIASFNEDSEAARQCNTLYDQTRLTVLEEHKWNFTQRKVALASVDVPSGYSQYSYAYSYPSDALLVHKIYDSTDNEAEFEVDMSKVETVRTRLIFTDQEAAIAVYTADVEDTALFGPLFVETLKYYLASKLAYSLGKNFRTQQTMLQLYDVFLNKAKTKNAKENHKPQKSSSWVTQRVGIL